MQNSRTFLITGSKGDFCAMSETARAAGKFIESDAYEIMVERLDGMVINEPDDDVTEIECLCGKVFTSKAVFNLHLKFKAGECGGGF